MKKLIFYIISLTVFNASFSQEFVFSMYFEDASGNKDTLFLGYDISATESIDAIFGEENIIDIPLDEQFDVRVTNANYNYSGTFHTKKQIINNSCNIPYTVIPVIKFDIKCSNWPITASWDSTLFADICNYYSDLASYPYYDALWDVMRPNDFSISLGNQDLWIFDKCDWEYDYNSTSYINSYNDTLYLFYIGIDDEYIMLDIESNELFKNEISISNDKDNLFVEIKDKDIELDNVQIIDMSGKVILNDNKNNINISDLANGIYLLRLQTNDKKVHTFKFIK